MIRGEFTDLKLTFKTELMSHVAEAIKPLTDCFDAILAAITKTSQTAEKALEATTVLQSEIKTLHLGEDILHEC